MMTREDVENLKMARAISKRLKPSRPWTPMQLLPEHYRDDATMWENYLYTATLRRYAQGWPFGGGPWAAIGICCEDGEARHDWRDFQRIKNDLVGAEWEAIELYPAESRLMDPSNYYMLWCAPRIEIGKSLGRVLCGPENAMAPQRGWSGDAPAEVKRKL